MPNEMRRPTMAQSGAQGMNWGNLFLGIILFISPWYSMTSRYIASSWNAWILGIAIIIVAFWTASTPSSQVPEWIAIILGAWVFISPWVLGFAGLPIEAWSAWILGILVVILATWALTQMQRPRTPIRT